MFIEYSKRSKKEQKKADNLSRKSWVITKPITKVIPSKKLYSRKGGGNFECNEHYHVECHGSGCMVLM